MKITARLMSVAGLIVFLFLGLTGIARAGVNRWTPDGLSGIGGPVTGRIPSSVEYIYFLADVSSVLAVSPNYAIDHTVYAGSEYEGGLHKSTDGGSRWTAMNNGLPTNPNIFSLAVSPNYANDGTVYAGTGNGVYKSTNGGSSWTAVNSGITTALIQSLAISPDYATDQTVYAGTYGGVFKSTDGGSSWIAVNIGIINASIQSLAISPNYANDQTVFAGTFFWGVLISTDGGSSWTAANNGLPTYPNIYSLAVSPNYANDGTVYVGIDNCLFMSTSGGWSWYPPTNMDLPLGDYNSLAISPNYGTDQTVYAMINGVGVYKTTNGGTDWIDVNNGLTNAEITGITSLAVSPNYATDHTVYTGASFYAIATTRLVYGVGVFKNLFTPPKSVISRPKEEAFISGTTYSITGRASGAGSAKVQSIEVGITPRGGATTWQTATGLTSWSCVGDFSAGDGIYVIQSKATDNMGNVETPGAGVSVTVDTTPPTSTITAPSNGATLNGKTYTITGTASDATSGVKNVQVGITPSGGKTTWYPATGTTSWSYKWTLPKNGSYTIQSKATDKAGNVESPTDSESVTVSH